MFLNEIRGGFMMNRLGVFKEEEEKNSKRVK